VKHKGSTIWTRKQEKQHAKPAKPTPSNTATDVDVGDTILVNIGGQPSTPDNSLLVSPLTAPTALLLVVLFTLTHTNRLLRWFNVAC